MRLRLIASVFALCALMRAETAPIETTKATLDVGIIVSDIEKAKAFYGGVLGLAHVTQAMPDGTTMYRFQSGSSSLKVRAFPKAAKYSNALRGEIGIRLLTLFTYDLDGVVKRYVAGGAAQPRVVPYGSRGVKLGFLTDPDGNELEIVGLPGVETSPAPDRMQIGLTVSDPEKSRAFYGQILGLAEDKPQAQELLNGSLEYFFNAGKTQIKFWTGEREDLPRHTGNITDAMGFRYFTFLVKDVDATFAELKKRGATIVREPVDFGGIARIMMAADPDGNWVEFAAPKARPAK